MKRLQKNKSIAQKQEYLSVVDMTMQHQKKKRKCMNTLNIKRMQNRQHMKKLKNIRESFL